MKRAGWSVAVGTLVSVGAMGLGAPGRETAFGLAGPLAVSSVSGLLMEWTYRRDPQQLTSVMVAAFGAKMVFFGAYVAVMLKMLSLRPVPFMMSFTASFIALHLAEAFSLRRLFAEQARASQ
jgi:hypothetical protein